MKLNDIYKAADKLAPFSLSAEYVAKLGYYDNSGIILDCGRDITGILFSLDLSKRSAMAAKQAGANCIFTHHPAIWEGVKRISLEENAALALCVREGISVISAHLNLDAAEGGIDECLMNGLGGETPLAIHEKLTDGGYGRVYDVHETPLERFAAQVAEEFCTSRLTVYGERAVSRVASFCGGGFTSAAIEFAREQNADTIVSSDGKHHLILEAVESGLNLVLLTHYAAENYGFIKFARRMKSELGRIPVYTFTDKRFL